MRLPTRTAMIVDPVCQPICEAVVRNGSTPRLGWRSLWHARMWSNIAKNCEKLVRRERLQSSTVVWNKQSVGERRRVPKFGVEAGPGLPVVQFEKRFAKAGDGNREIPQQKQQIAKVVEKPQKPVTMAAGAAKRIPLIRFPNRKAGETQGAKAVNRASGRGGPSQQAMPSLPSGTASSQPPRTILSEAEIDAVLLGAVVEEPVKKKLALRKNKFF